MSTDRSVYDRYLDAIYTQEVYQGSTVDTAGLAARLGLELDELCALIADWEADGLVKAASRGERTELHITRAGITYVEHILS